MSKPIKLTRQGVRDLGSSTVRGPKREPYCWHVWDEVADRYYLDFGHRDPGSYEKCIKCGKTRS